MSNKLRYYQIKDKCYPSVTTVLSAKPNYALEKWKEKLGEEKAREEAERSAKRGTNVHKMIEIHLLGGRVLADVMWSAGVSPNDYELFKQIKKNVNQIQNVRAIEDFLYSDKIKLAGTVDCVGSLEGKISVIDFKTSNKMKQKPIENHLIQCTAYSLMYEEIYHVKVDQIALMYTCEDGTTQNFYADPDDYKEKLTDLVKYFVDNEKRLIDERSVEIIKK